VLSVCFLIQCVLCLRGKINDNNDDNDLTILTILAVLTLFVSSIENQARISFNTNYAQILFECKIQRPAVYINRSQMYVVKNSILRGDLWFVYKIQCPYIPKGWGESRINRKRSQRSLYLSTRPPHSTADSLEEYQLIYRSSKVENND